MSRTTDRTEYRVLRGLAVIAALPPLATLAGWHFHQLSLMQWAAGSVPMQYNAALGLLLAAAAFFVLFSSRPKWAKFPAAAALCIGAATAAEHLLDWNLHIDELFFKAWLVTAYNSAPGRMALNTSLCLVSAGVALLLSSGRSPLSRYRSLTVALAGSVPCAIGLVALIGYLTNIESAYRWGHLSNMSASTAVCCLILGAGLIARVVSDAGGGNFLQHRWTPAVLGGVAMVFTLLIWNAVRGDQNASQLRASQAVASQTAVRLRLVAVSFTRALARLGERWPAGRPFTGSEWERDAGSYLRDYPGLRSVEWVDDAFVTQRAVPRGIGHNWNPEVREVQAVALRAAARTGGPTASRVVALETGRVGFLIVAPASGLGQRSYTTTVIELAPLLSYVVGQQTAESYAIAVTVGGVEVFRRGDTSQKPHRGEASSDVGFSQVKWAVRSWPEPAAVSAAESSLGIGVLLAGLLVSALVALTTHLIRVSHQHAMALEVANQSMQDEIHVRRLAESGFLAATRTAEAATRAKSEFLARMSHEIRTPMNAILGMASLLWESKLDGEQRQYVGAFRRAGNNLLTLINDILDLSKIEAGRMELASVEFELDDVVAATMDLIRVRADDKGLAIISQLSSEIHGSLRGDPDKLRQVLINLLGNAVKFTDAGQVCLSVERYGVPQEHFESLRFAVSDTGVGIAPEKQALIFETFMQADGSISRQYGGTGLGLTISRQIVERMGGRLEVSSDPPHGSTFSFTLLFEVATPREVRPESASSSASAPAASELKILLVEDSRDNQLLICAYLKGTAQLVEIAANGQIAVEKFKTGTFDLVLMDVQMPVMDGYQATRTIREWEVSEGLPRTPILALSAHAMEEAFEKSLEAGCDVHLTKPITKAVLLHAIAQHTNSRPALGGKPAELGKDLAPWYLDRRREDLVALSTALGETNYDAVRVMGHNMKGSGRGYGFDPISKIGAALEAAAVKRSDTLIESEISALDDYLKTVEAKSR